MEDLTKHEEIVDVSFDHEGAHLAMCHQLQGSANKRPVPLLLKAEETELNADIIKALAQVTVKLSFEEFVCRFFGMYYDDAELLAKLLGFQTEHENGLEQEEAPESYEAYVEAKASKFEVMKSCFEAKDFNGLEPNDALEVIKTQVLFEKSLSLHEAEIEKGSIGDDDQLIDDPRLQSSELPEDIKKETEVSNVNSKDPTRTNKLDSQEFMKSEEGQEILKAAIAQAIEAKDAELIQATESLEKAAAELEVFKIEKAERKLKGFVNFTKSLSFVDEEKQEALADVLLKASEVEGMEMIVEMLEKAQEKVVAVKQEFLKSEEGFETKHDEPVVIDKASDLAEQLAAKYADQKFQM